ncbi:MAG: hypothetical protein IKO93_17585 [Lentisphaeria bacterium]|nr:hypothetical protein [Lentisphaeria bacterium]
MKNIIPVIVAVVLGLAGVFAVNRIVSKQSVKPEEKIMICAASRTLKANETVSEEYIYPKAVSVSSLPQQYIAYDNRNMVIGQKTLFPIAKNDYILLSNVGTTSSMSNVLSDGEWGCPVKFSDTTLLNVIQPGDEIAIIALYQYRQIIKREKDVNAKAEEITRQVATVLYPQVRVLEKRGSSIIISMPPQQAIALTAIQQRAQLFPLLRKANDSKGLNRKAGGIFELSNEFFAELADGLQKIEIPSVPSGVKNLK